MDKDVSVRISRAVYDRVYEISKSSGVPIKRVIERAIWDWDAEKSLLDRVTELEERLEKVAVRASLGARVAANRR